MTGFIAHYKRSMYADLVHGLGETENAALSRALELHGGAVEDYEITRASIGVVSELRRNHRDEMPHAVLIGGCWYTLVEAAELERPAQAA